jgi:hypothetical protein
MSTVTAMRILDRTQNGTDDALLCPWAVVQLNPSCTLFTSRAYWRLEQARETRTPVFVQTR